jgi:hypothetical protein
MIYEEEWYNWGVEERYYLAKSEVAKNLDRTVIITNLYEQKSYNSGNLIIISGDIKCSKPWSKNNKAQINYINKIKDRSYNISTNTYNKFILKIDEFLSE